MLWTLDPTERDAYLANESTKMFTKNIWVLVEIACTRPSLEFFKTKQAYHVRYKTSLEEDVAYHTSGNIRKVVKDLCISFFKPISKFLMICCFVLTTCKNAAIGSSCEHLQVRWKC